MSGIVDGNELRSGPSSQIVPRTAFLLMSQDVPEPSEMSALFFFVPSREGPERSYLSPSVSVTTNLQWQKSLDKYIYRPETVLMHMCLITQYYYPIWYQ